MGYAGNIVDETFTAALYMLAGQDPIDDENKRTLVRFHLKSVEDATTGMMRSVDGILQHLANIGTPLPKDATVATVSAENSAVVAAVATFLNDAKAVTDQIAVLVRSLGLVCGKGGEERFNEVVKTQLKYTRAEKISWDGENTVVQVNLLTARYELQLPTEDTRGEWLAAVTNGVLKEATQVATFTDLQKFVSGVVLSANATDTALYTFLTGRVSEFGIEIANALYQQHLDAI